MSDVAVLGALKWTELRNRARTFGRQSKFKVVVIGFFSAAFWVSLFMLFHYGLDFLHGVAVGYNFHSLIDAMFYVFFFALTVMLVFSNAIIGYSSYFKAKETSFLLASPARPESVFLCKFVESLGFSSWAFLFLGTPLMAAYGRVFDVPWHFYLTSGVFLAAYMAIPAAIGAIVVLLVTVYLPRTKKGLLVGGIAAAVLGAVLVGLRIAMGEGGQAVDLRLASQVFEHTRFSRLPALPSYWLSKGILELAGGRYEASAFFFGLIVSNVAFLVTIAHVMSRGLLMRGWHVSQGLRTARRYGATGWMDRAVHGLLFFVDPRVRAIVVKDLKSFVRDPVQWSQFLIFFGLLGIYFLNLRTFAYEDR
ncbi:MAG TPA: hypothetical protein VEJ18_09675, partial [Planctomycetota bacterium]|nr:hypothetical protein [Planctomycetota bacterium]